MAQSLTKNYIHLIFSTKNRECVLVNPYDKQVFAYLGGICKQLNCSLVQVGGHRDHVHILCILAKDITLIDLVKTLKASSSKWIKQLDPRFAHFSWQLGYGAFSVSPKDIAVISNYIKNQEQHHKSMTFQEEFIRFLKKYCVPYDERYIWR